MKRVKNQKIINRLRRRSKIRARIAGTSSIPRLSVFRSNKYIYAQLIDDTKGITIVAASDIGTKGKTKVERANEVGKTIAKLAKEKNIDKVVFDRGGFIFTGRIKALAQGARDGGLIF